LILLKKGTAYMIPGKCKLCQNDNVLLMESHIIPEFAYKPVYDKHHRFIDFSEDPRTGVKFAQKGIRENLLCGSCEVLLSKHEKILSDFTLNLNQNKNNIIHLSDEFLLNTNINYDSVKLAVLSIIFRLSVSKLPQYTGYELGPFEQEIRDIILHGRHIDRYKFSMHISPVTRNGIYYPDLIMTYEKPSKYKNIYTFLCFIMYGLLFDVMISKIDKCDCWHYFSLREKGKIIMQNIEINNVNIKADLIKRFKDEDMIKLIRRLKK